MRRRSAALRAALPGVAEGVMPRGAIINGGVRVHIEVCARMRVHVGEHSERNRAVLQLTGVLLVGCKIAFLPSHMQAELKGICET